MNHLSNTVLNSASRNEGKGCNGKKKKKKFLVGFHYNLA